MRKKPEKQASESEIPRDLRVDREQFEGVVKKLLHTNPVKREDVRVKNPKNREKLIPPPKD